MSGYARPVLASQGRLDPNVALVEKPFSESDLLAKAGEVLNGHFGGLKPLAEESEPPTGQWRAPPGYDAVTLCRARMRVRPGSVDPHARAAAAAASQRSRHTVVSLTSASSSTRDTGTW